MKIIALRGPHSCGKTTTMTLVHDELIKNGAISTNKKQEGGNVFDFSDTLTWKGMKIGFLTMGDYSYVITDFINDFEKKKYDVFMTACNERFVKPFNRISGYPGSHIHHKIKAANANLEATENTADSLHLFGLV